MIKNLIHKFLGKRHNEMFFQNSMDLAELPVVTFHQGDVKVNLLLDTGSNNCIIDSSTLNSLRYTPLKGSTKISGLEGNVQTSSTCLINLSYKNTAYEYPYVIQDMSAVFGSIKKETGVSIHGILGSKFFNEYKYVLDFDELIAYTKK